jgi:hypothetical protein
MSPFDPDMFESNLFPVEPETFSETLHRREASARKTLRKASVEELQGLVFELFPDGEHPWFASFLQLIEQHRSEPAYRGGNFRRVRLRLLPTIKSWLLVRE